MMMKKIIHVFFVITGVMLGYLYVPDIIRLLNISDNTWLTSAYLGSVLGAIIFFILSYLLADYLVGFLKWVEEGLIKIPVVDLFFGTIGLLVGLFVAYLINIPLQDISLKIVSEIVPLFLSLIVGFFGFEVGFCRGAEFLGLLTLAFNGRGS